MSVQVFHPSSDSTIQLIRCPKPSPVPRVHRQAHDSPQTEPGGSCRPVSPVSRRWGPPFKVLAMTWDGWQPSAGRALEPPCIPPGSRHPDKQHRNPTLLRLVSHVPWALPPLWHGAASPARCHTLGILPASLSQQGVASLGDRGISPECTWAPPAHSKGWTAASLPFPPSYMSLLHTHASASRSLGLRVLCICGGDPTEGFSPLHTLYSALPLASAQEIE